VSDTPFAAGYGSPFDAFEGPRPLRRPVARGVPLRRRRKSGVAALLAGAALRALLVVALPVAVVVWLLYSPYFLIRQVEVDGGARVSAAWVRAELQPLVGRHVLAVSLEGVRRRLSSHPWVASVELRRQLPNRLRVAIVERQPVALLRSGDDYLFLDAQGLPIASCPADAPARADKHRRLLVLRDHLPHATLLGGVLATAAMSDDPDVAPARRHAHGKPAPAAAASNTAPMPVPVLPALALVEELRHAQAAWAAGVTEVEILGEGDYRVQTGALPYPLLLRSGTVNEAVANLERALPAIAARLQNVEEVDLRQPHRLVVRAGTPPVAPARATASAASALHSNLIAPASAAAAASAGASPATSIR
jgi:hypothetical protein